MECSFLGKFYPLNFLNQNNFFEKILGLFLLKKKNEFTELCRLNLFVNGNESLFALF